MNKTTVLKLNLLQEKSVISEKVYDQMFTVDKFLSEKLTNFEALDTETMYVHLAMSLDRIEKNKALTDSNAFVEEQVKESIHYKDACKMLEGLGQEIGVSFNNEESIMILLHLCTLLEKQVIAHE